MNDQRLRRLFTERETVQGDDLFGVYDLLPKQPQQLAPIKRVAVLTEAFLPKVDGVSKTTYLTIRYLQQTGREVLVFAPDTAVPRVGPSQVVNLPSVTMPAAEETRIALPLPVIVKRLQAFKPDLIHLGSPEMMAINGMSAARQMNVPVVGVYQTDLPGYAVHYGAPLLERPLRNWLRYLHNGCHVNLVPTQKVLEDLQGHGFKRLQVWGRGVNIERFNPDKATRAMRERLLAGRDPDSLLCIYVGRLANEKRVDLLREVADLTGVALTIIGDGSSREELEAIFAGTGTHFTGYLFGDDLSAAFASSDVFMFTGPQETFGQVVQEAMASGLPSIVISQGAVGNLVLAGETGYVCDPQPHFFAEAMMKLRDNPALRRQMAQRARDVAETRPWSAIMSQLEQHYQQAYDLSRRFSRVFGETTYHQPFSIGAKLQWVRKMALLRQESVHTSQVS